MTCSTVDVKKTGRLSYVMVGLEGVWPHCQLVVQREGAVDTPTVEVEADTGGQTCRL